MSFRLAQRGMIIQHPFVTSDVFRLLTTLEFDLEIGDHFLPTRLELFQDTERPGTFRCRMWERDLFRLRPTPGTGAAGEAADGEADEELLIERTWELSDEFESFEAASPEAAINRVLDSLKAYLERIGGAGRS